MAGPAETLAGAALRANRDLARESRRAMSHKGLDAAMAYSLDSPDLLGILFGTVLRGPDALRESIRRMFENNESVCLEVDEISHIGCGGAAGSGSNHKVAHDRLAGHNGP